MNIFIAGAAKALPVLITASVGRGRAVLRYHWLEPAADGALAGPLMDTDIAIRRVAPDDIALMEALMATFGDAFGDVETYTGRRPSGAYLRRLLGSDCFIALAALKDGGVVGGIAAYELRKFEQERSEIYIYDLAVAMAHRREGIATALIEELGKVAAARGAYVIFVQSDTGVEDAAAIALYTKLGKREDVLQFDISVAAGDRR